MLQCGPDMISNPINELDVHALVDSQLTWEEETRVRKEIENNPFLRKEYTKLMEQKKLLSMWWDKEPEN